MPPQTSAPKEMEGRPRSVLVIESNMLDEVAEKITAEVERFVLLLVVEADKLSDAVVPTHAKRLLDRGAVYVCVWGPDCERVHDCFDRIIVSNATEPADGADCIMTTWHSRDTLEEAVWFFQNAANPTDGFRLRLQTKWCRRATGLQYRSRVGFSWHGRG